MTQQTDFKDKITDEHAHQTLMAVWYWYLLAVSLLSFTDYINLNIIRKATLAVLVHLPLRHIALKSRWVEYLKLFAVITIGFLFLWHESFLPPLTATVEFVLALPALSYVLDFLRQNINPKMLGIAAALLALSYWLARRKPLLLMTLAYGLLFTAWLIQPHHHINAEADHLRSAFFQYEADRLVEFTAPDSKSPPFDIILLNICSLSWQDLKDADAEEDALPFLSNFDYILANYNTASTYSASSVLGILKSPCGQQPLSLLFQDAPPTCYLMDRLKDFGYKQYTMFNHDGSFNDMGDKVQQLGHMDAPLRLDGLPVAYTAFNGRPVYDDKAVLMKYWQLRQESRADRAVLLYDTASLHVGANNDDMRGPDNRPPYKRRLRRLIAELEEFFSVIEKSGRKAVVIFVPEHGAALSGSKFQPQDLREIPLPSITLVPVAVKLLGEGFTKTTQPEVIFRPTGPLGLSWLIAKLLRHNPYTKNARSPQAIAAGIPRTAYLSETGSATVMRLRGEFIYKRGDWDWEYLPAYTRLQPSDIPSARNFKRAPR